MESLGRQVAVIRMTLIVEVEGEGWREGGGLLEEAKEEGLNCEGVLF